MRFNNYTTFMNTVQKIGLTLFVIGFGVWVATLSLGKYTLTDNILSDTLNVKKEHYELLKDKAKPMFGKTYSTAFAFSNDFSEVQDEVNEELKKQKKDDQVIYDNYAFPVNQSGLRGADH